MQVALNFDSDLAIIKNEPVDLWLVAIPPSSWTQDVTNSNRDSFKPKEGTTRYAAPEVLWSRQTYNLHLERKDAYLKDPFKVDVYSFGITAYEVLTGLTPFDHQNLTMKMLKKKIMDHDLDLAKDFFKTFKEETKNYPERFVSFMQRCWAYDPEGRPSFQEIIEKIEEAKEDLMSFKRPSRAGMRSRVKNVYKGAKTFINQLAPKGVNNQVSKTPTPPPNTQLLMSILKGHTQYVDIISLVFKIISASLSLWASSDIFRTFFREQLPDDGWIF